MSVIEKKFVVLSMWQNGHTASEIAMKVRTTRSAVMGIVHRAREAGVIGVRDRDKKIQRPRVNVESPPKPPEPPKPPRLPKVLLTVKHPKPVVEVELPVVSPPPPVGVTFHGLSKNSCRYTISGKNAKEYLFCGEPKTKGSYCAKHAAMCYVPLSKGKRPERGYNYENPWKRPKV